jgi:hypothetical protein
MPPPKVVWRSYDKLVAEYAGSTPQSVGLDVGSRGSPLPTIVADHYPTDLELNIPYRRQPPLIPRSLLGKNYSVQVGKKMSYQTLIRALEVWQSSFLPDRSCQNGEILWPQGLVP